MGNRYQEIHDLVEMLKSYNVGTRYTACCELGDASTITEEAINALKEVVENDHNWKWKTLL